MAVVDLGGQEIVDPPTAGAQTNASVASLADDGYVVVWNENNQIEAQIFNAFGQAQGSEIQVGVGLNAMLDPVVTGLGNGGFEVAWQYDILGNGSEYDIAYQGYTAAGATSGSQQTLVPLLTSTSQFSPSITTIGSTYSISYVDNADHIGYLSGNGTAGETTLPSAGSGSAAGGLGQTLILATTVGSGASSQIEAGELFSIMKVSTSPGAGVSGAQVAGLASGLYAVVWDEASTSTNPAPAPSPAGTGSTDYSVQAQLVYINQITGGQSVYGPQFLVNTLGTQAVDPKVTTLSDGGFVVTWQTNATGDDTIDGQEYNAYGAAIGSEFIISTEDSANQVSPTIAQLSDGRLIAVWQSGATGESTLEQQILDPREGLVEGTAGNDVLVAGNGDQEVLGLGGNDTVYAGIGDQQIYGGTGNDIIDLAAGNGYVDGGSGFNIASLGVASSAATLTQNANLSWTVTSALGAETLTNIQSLAFTNQTVSLRTANPDDFTGTGSSGVLFENSSGGLIDWTLARGAYAGYFPIGAPTGYNVAGDGDFNGDGTADILLQNAGGNLIAWTLRNGTYRGYDEIGNPMSSGYGIVGTGDFNGDGTTDILLENGGGGLIDWMVNNGSYAGYNVIGNPASSGYGVVGTGDFNGDGTTDVLLENGAGNLIDWTLQNGAYKSYNEVGSLGSTGYGIVGTGDFNGNGTSDLLLKNASGQLIDWMMKNGMYDGYNTIGNISGYKVAAIGDYTGNGVSDILLQNSSNGGVLEWTMANGVHTGTIALGSDTGYSIVK